MKQNELLLRGEEEVIYKLRALYSKYGYSPYKVNKFEEYDLYARNKSFLVSENLLTFTDTNGKLMALKPDVTLSIIKNAVADDAKAYKLYYNENVYRTTQSGNGFREIMQTGLEAIGNIDLYTQCEVLMLAAHSLENISEAYILDLSHMRFLEGLLESTGVDDADKPEFFSLIGSKNVSGVRALCAKRNIDADAAERICRVASVYLPIKQALKALSSVVEGEKMQSAYKELSEIEKVMNVYGLSGKLYLDFSVVNDMSYYDGIIFKGFVDGIPDSVLSGGRYDRLLKRFGKQTEAIGFAVYLDKLEYFRRETNDYDVDVMLIYDGETAPEKVIEAVKAYTAQGKSVRTLTSPESGIRFREAVKLGKDGMQSETDD